MNIRKILSSLTVAAVLSSLVLVNTNVETKAADNNAGVALSADSECKITKAGGVTTVTIKDTIKTKQMAPYYTNPSNTRMPAGVVPGGVTFNAVGITSNGFYMVKSGNGYYYIPCSFCVSLTSQSTTVNTTETKTHGKIYEVGESDFEEEVLNYDGFVLVDFYAEWCGPCMNMKPKLEKIAKEHPEFKIVEVNVDYCDNLSYQYGISSIPALFCFKNGELEYNTVGGRSEKELLKLINTYK